MIVKAVKTRRVEPDYGDIFKLLDDSINQLDDGSIVAVTSKVISLCEGRVIPKSTITLEELAEQESDFYMQSSANKYGYHFTISNNTLISLGGVDESNSGDNYVLWPKNPQQTANEIREYLKNRFGLAHVGIVITDSTVIPMRWGTMGLALAYSGFSALKNYIGKPDLFGRPFKVSQAGIANGLAATAVLAMGEGTEQTPIVIINDVSFVEFVDHNPTAKELKFFNISREDDLFGPFLNSVKWQKGKRKNT